MPRRPVEGGNRGNMKSAMNRFLSVALVVMFVSGSALGQPHTNTDTNNASQPDVNVK